MYHLFISISMRKISIKLFIEIYINFKGINLFQFQGENSYEIKIMNYELFDCFIFNMTISINVSIIIIFVLNLQMTISIPLSL